MVPGTYEVPREGGCCSAAVCPEARTRMCSASLVNWTSGEVHWGLAGNAQGVTDVVQFAFSRSGLHVTPEIVEPVLALGQSDFGYYVI